MADLFPLFENLERPLSSQGDNRFSAQSIPGFEQHRVAKDKDGAPVLLIAVDESAGRYPTVPISLEHLRILHNMQCLISKDDGTQEVEKFTVVQCIGNDLTLHRYFLRMLGGILPLLGSNPSQADVSLAIAKLVELFRLMTEPARKSIQGFWAELFLVAGATNPIALIDAWHATPTDVYDFNAGDQRIEVKSVAGHIRQHHFALEQLQPPVGTRVVIASLLMERAGAGVSVGDLLEEVRIRLNGNPELLVRLDQIAISSLGEGWRRALDVRFDRQIANQSLRFFESSVIPSVALDIPSNVSAVHFRSDLTGLPSLNRQWMRSAGGLFRTALPR